MLGEADAAAGGVFGRRVAGRLVDPGLDALAGAAVVPQPIWAPQPYSTTEMQSASTGLVAADERARKHPSSTRRAARGDPTVGALHEARVGCRVGSHGLLHEAVEQ